MNWAKGGSQKTGRGSSIKGTCDYILHDKDGINEDRVGEIVMLNLAADDPKKAWREIQTTIDAAAALKERNGIPQTGTKNIRPIYAISLSWHPDEKPTTEHMMETARGVVERLGLSKHQVLIVQHRDRPHAHVHIAANLIHPDTGKTAHLGLDEMKLDAWAHTYESQRVIRSFQRAAKMQQREIMKLNPNARNEFAKAVDSKVREVRDGIAAKRAGLSGRHEAAAINRKTELKALWKELRQRRSDIQKDFEPILENVRKAKAPALSIPPPSLGGRPEWMVLAKSMLQQGMFKQRHVLNQTFARSLSKISPAQTLGALAQKFHLVREGRDVMLPIRNTPDAKRYAANHQRLPARVQREREIRFLKNVELAKATTRPGLPRRHPSRASGVAGSPSSPCTTVRAKRSPYTTGAGRCRRPRRLKRLSTRSSVTTNRRSTRALNAVCSANGARPERKGGSVDPSPPPSSEARV